MIFQGKIVVVTGGAGGIGKCITDEFRKARAEVCVIDTAPGARGSFCWGYFG